MRFHSTSNTETAAIGGQLATKLAPGSIVTFFGELGAGKTTCIKGIATALTGMPEEAINSPTFGYMHIYPGRIPVYHFDLYRLNNSGEFIDMGFDEYLYADGVCCIEWSERIADILPAGAITISATHAGGDNRIIEIMGIE
jgi:tRNA threonylcarbamoyladenosine biosynthesis protein TsaE